ncbi:hypothetical protein [Streptomyces sp. NPDC046161]|uniref:hypothetical protein n=1 Tax=Streptomyces sp. NPDC046161 TaxID=3155132 RepID=UPI0033D652BC
MGAPGCRLRGRGAGARPETAEQHVDLVPLTMVMEALGVKQTAAGDIRRAAAVLLESGYRPDQLETELTALFTGREAGH